MIYQRPEEKDSDGRPRERIAQQSIKQKKTNKIFHTRVTNMLATILLPNEK
jgi:hypothetical protein